MTTDSESTMPAAEPWMRGMHADLDSVRRGIIHALEQALEDADRWTAALDDTLLESRPAHLPSVAFHLRHIARSLDRLLTYAEDRQLSDEQLAALRTEEERASKAATLSEFLDGLHRAIERIAQFRPEQLEESRGIGRKRLPTTIGGLLIHCAEHTQRHIGQMITTAKIAAQRTEA